MVDAKPRWSTRSEDDLIEACARGDGGALGALFDRHHQGVYRFLARLSGTDERDLDDLVQNTFVRLPQAASSFGGRSSVRSWIFAIASHVAKDHIRAEIRRRNLIQNAAVDVQTVVDRPDHRAEALEMLSRFGAALGGLPHDLRVAYVMCEIEDTPGKDAAAALGIPEGTLWRRLHEARAALRRVTLEPSVATKEAVNDRS